MVTPRYPVGTSVKKEIKDRIQKLRKIGYSVPELILLGIEQAELEVERANNGNNLPRNKRNLA